MQQENDLQHSPNPFDDPLDDPMLFQRDLSPLDDPLLFQRDPNALDDPQLFQQPPSPLDDPPFDPPANEDSEGSNDLDEDLNDDDMPPRGLSEPSNSHQIVYEPWNEEDSLDNENPEGFTANDDENLNENAGHNPSPQPTIPMLILANDMIENIRTARLEDDLPNKMLARLRNPPREPAALDPKTEMSMGIFNALLSGSQQMYNSVKHVLSRHRPTPIVLDSYHVVKTKIERATGVAQIPTDMCINSCIAYTGPFKDLDKCPKCATERYKENSNKVPRQQFYTIPLGPQIQALWRTPDGGNRMRYRNRKTDEILEELQRSGRIPTYEDVLHHQET